MFVCNLTLTIVTIALPVLARDLDSPRAFTNWVTLAPMLVVALCTPGAGRASDRYGHKRVWAIGLALALVGNGLSAIAPDLVSLLMARVLAGVGNALVIPAGLALASDCYEPNERAIPVGYWTSTLAISPMFGILLGGWLLDWISWRGLFAGQLLLGVPVLAAAMYTLDEKRPPSSAALGPFDLAGALAVGTTALAGMLLATYLPSLGATDPVVVTLALVVALGVLTCIRVERRAAQPVVPPALLRDPVVSLSIAIRLLLNFTYMGAFITLPYLMTEVWGLTPFAISSILLARPLAMAVTGALAGRMSQRLGLETLVLLGGVALLMASLLFSALGATTDLRILLPALLIAGAGLGMSSPGTTAMITQRAPETMLGTASALVSLSATIANSLGMAVLFAVVESQGGVSSIAAHRNSFLVGAGCVAVGLLLSTPLARAWRSRSADGQLLEPDRP